MRVDLEIQEARRAYVTAMDKATAALWDAIITSRALEDVTTGSEAAVLSDFRRLLRAQTDAMVAEIIRADQ